MKSSTTLEMSRTIPPTQQTAGRPCSFLQRFPPELRNIIYALTFSIEQDSEVNLLEAAPPSGALTQTCGQIYSEARAMYRHAYREHWRTSRFTLQLTVDDRARMSASRFGNLDEWQRACYNQERAVLDSMAHLEERNLRPIQDSILIQIMTLSTLADFESWRSNLDMRTPSKRRKRNLASITFKRTAPVKAQVVSWSLFRL